MFGINNRRDEWETIKACKKVLRLWGREEMPLKNMHCYAVIRENFSILFYLFKTL